ncbi:myosin-like protein [Plasmopara halstedii]|uniref:Myosin-like protein n=1 Tax=Plasmopara halstedii TaxID=4781 RepID=A0A0P1AM72_PLAHL|nr:myosin-like protein [Plasmopara halstedii]CEG42290.1 myosin-like protein [Plasmopara halstedii]|eukprot:XP_024578659.1 myosin-like protein [Plasmopara halstedii]
MLESRSSCNELDLAYMPYHEGLVNNNAPPARSNLSIHKPTQQYSQQSPYYEDSDDDVSDDPVWMMAPSDSLQPAFPSSLMKKSSTISVTDTQHLSSERTNLALATDSRKDISSNDNGYRDSMMRYRPSDVKLHEMNMMMSRDSLAPENFQSSYNNMKHEGTSTDDQLGHHRSSNMFDSSRGISKTSSSDLLSGSVMHFGLRVADEGLSDFLRAAKTGNLEVLRNHLEDQTTSFIERDPVHGQTALHIAVRFGQFLAVKLLCAKRTRGLLIDAVDNRRNTPLHLAAAKSRRITKFLLESGASTSCVNNRNQTPLAVHLLTTKRDDPLIAEMLLQHNTDPNSPLGNGTLLHKALELQCFEIGYRLVRYGARLDAKDADGCMVFDKVDCKVLRQLLGKIAFPPVWVPDSERKNCMICLRDFNRLGVGVRRHHCRHCGRLICGRCSHVSVESEAFPSTFVGHIDRNPSDERSNLKRVCKTCSNVFDERAKLAKQSSSDRTGLWSSAFMGRVVGCSWDEAEGKRTSCIVGRSSFVP